MDKLGSDQSGYYDPGGRTESSLEATPPIQPIPSTRNTKANTSTTKVTKSSSATKSSTGPRFQCPKCPKNFSRIENLTRHQANHEDIGKFACSQCKKRFTRSDLLNRHRRIHSTTIPEGNSSHVTQMQFGSVPLPSNPHFVRAVSQEEIIASTPQNAIIPDQVQARLSAQHSMSSMQPEGYHLSNLNRSAYQPQIPLNNPLIMSQPQGLTNLMEAALAPQAQFNPARHVNQVGWDSEFDVMGRNEGHLMGAFDGDMSWVMESFNAESLSNYSSDYDMLNTFSDVQHWQQHQPVQYLPPQQILPPPPRSNINTNEDEDDETNDWPDKIDKQISQAPRIVPVGFTLAPTSWQSLLDEARVRPIPSTVPQFDGIDANLRQSLIEALNGDPLRNEFTIAEISDAMFPPAEILDFFLRLYFQFIQPRFPVIHIPTFELYDSPPLLLITMMLLGSCHSFSDRDRFSGTFYHNLRVACLRMQELDSKYMRSLDNILTYFLLCLGGTWSMSKESYEFAEGSRGVLVTACRRMRLFDCRPSSFDPSKFRDAGYGLLETKWLNWIDNEKGKRLGLSVYMYDCQYPALFNNQHYVSKAEITNCVFPCDEALWEAPAAESWKGLLGAVELPKAEYWMAGLNSCLLRRYIQPIPQIVKPGEFGKVLLLYAIHTHIYDWRQATCMLAPTGLLDLKHEWDMGNPLRERRIWLINGLDSWAECYQDENTATAAKLLHRLGYIGLDLNLSDMHLIAGRSHNQDDGTFAEHNMKRWANSDTATSTMSHIYGMLAICHQQVRNNTAAECSYEIAVCLFTGGIVCWAYARLKENAPREECMLEVLKASKALRHMGAGGCYRSCALFGRILKGFKLNGRA